VALALHRAIQKVKLPEYYLKRLVDGRDKDLDVTSYMTVDDIVAHAESTASSLLYLQLAALNLSESEALAHAASHLGVATTFTTLLRSFPYHVAKGRIIIPTEITAKHNLRHEDVFRMNGNANALSDAVYEFATLAHSHLNTARQLFNDSGRKEAAMPIFIQGVPVAAYLERLEKANFQVYSESLRKRHWKLAWNVYFCYKQQKF